MTAAAGAAPKKYESLTSKAAIKSNTRSHENDSNYFLTGADRRSWRGVFRPRADERKRYGTCRCDRPRGRRLSALDRQARTGRLNPAAAFSRTARRSRLLTTIFGGYLAIVRRGGALVADQPRAGPSICFIVMVRSEHEEPRQRDHRARRNYSNRMPTHPANMC